MDDTTYDAAIVDRDGTVHRGNRLVPGVDAGRATARHVADRLPGTRAFVIGVQPLIGEVLLADSSVAPDRVLDSFGDVGEVLTA